MKPISARGISLWLVLLASMAASQAIAQQATKPAAQQAAKSARDLSGVWGRVTEGDHYNKVQSSVTFPQSAWSTEMLPFTAKGRAAFDANKPAGGPRQVRSELSNDPRDKANPGGLYRTLYWSTGARPFEFVQLSGKLIQLYSYGLNWHIIYTDGRPVPDDVAAGPFWYGHSVGKWEGNTLVVNTLALDERAWLDPWGTPISAEARVEERWQRIAQDKLQLQITVRDPAYYTRPWTSAPMIYALQKREEPQEMIFAPVDMDHFTRTLLVPASSSTR
jgi:hypothetical protein